MKEPFVSAEDKKFLKLALNLARRNVGLTGKNPSVGCVITFRDIILGRGNTQPGGRPHAEIMAIKQASEHYLFKKNRKINDINVYITLEPCAHETTSPSCAKEIVKFGANRVIYLATDPDIRTNGKGKLLMEEAGITCIESSIYENENSEILKGYLKQKKTGFPYITLKIGASMNGKIATKNGESKWVTNSLCRKRVQLLRSENDGILIGKNSIIIDNPRLNLREQFDKIENKPIFILDTNFELSASENLLLFDKLGRDKVNILTNREPMDVASKVSEFFEGVNIEKTAKEQGYLNIEDTLKIISRMGVNRLLVEGGARVWTSFIKTGFFDEIVIFTGNSIINDSSISCFNDFLPLDTKLRDFPNLTLISLLKWKDNIEARWIANS
tara:strand:- start:1604 stop:2761 length:1158 start_codon:yes stop_codon:yes gene_type:complete